MRRPSQIALAALGALLCFGAGAWYTASRSAHTTAAGVRRVLYYQDPMHPAYKSDKPGTAPDCGMDLVPVYADGGPSERGIAPSLPPGSVRMNADRQQMIGVRVEEVRKTAPVEPIRVPGRVASDETRVYKVNATVDGWIRQINPAVTTGSLVAKDETLASYYAPEFLGAMQAYLFAVGAMDRFQAAGNETPEQIKLTQANIQQAKDSLQVLGMSESQANEIAKTRELTQNVRIVAPAAGFVVARNVSPGQRFEKGTEFFRIADLRRVWVLADLFENQASLVKSATSATVRYEGRTYRARVSSVLPIFDPSSRTLKMRLEVENPEFALRPDMFVDVELPMHVSEALTVPAGAVVLSGRRTIVYVDRGSGAFEPRMVETGWRYGDRVAITRGLDAGERVASGGNFLLDSESRLQLAAKGPAPAAEDIDPVCGMTIKTPTYSATFQRRAYRFCSASCKRDFEAHPERFTEGEAR